jgi:antirestriction protein ArdC
VKEHKTPNRKEEIMKADQAKKLADEALAKLAAALEAGQSEALSAYLAALGRFHRYSFGNVMMIAAQRPDASQVAGFHTWRKLGRFVRKGEKGIAIIAPIVYKKDAQGAAGETEVALRGFRVVHVFDVSQTDGEELPKLTRIAGDPGAYTERLKDLIQHEGIDLCYSEELGSADGRSSGGTITLALGLGAAEKFSVLVHELAHEFLHHTGQGRATRTTRETEAEAVAFAVSDALGLKTGTASSDYIQLYDGDKETLGESLDRIQRTATRILTALEAPA